MRFFALAFVITALVGPGGAHAQCQRTSPYAEEDIAEVAATFYDSEYVENRGTAIQLLTAADTQYVVRDDLVCQAVLDRVLPLLRQHDPAWGEGKAGDYVATVYRFGPYYAVEMMREESPDPDAGILGVVKHGRSPFLIYRAADLTLLRVLY